MDYSALLNTLLSKENVKEISKETGASADEVSRVVKSAVPFFMEHGAQANEAKLTRAASNGTNRSILGTLLGAGASAAISQNSGVSNKKTSSILSLVAPLLLSSMLGNSSNASSNSGLSSLLGGLLGLGGTQQQTVQVQQNNNTAGTLSLLSSLLGAGMAQPQQQVQQQNTLNLLGGLQQQPVQQQTYQQNTAAGASLLGSLLGMGNLGQAQQSVQVQQPQQQTINLLGGAQQTQGQDHGDQLSEHDSSSFSLY